jgi:predicted nucleic acid-binding protein
VKVLLDTNILLRFKNRADPAAQAIADTMASLVRGGAEPCICAQNVVEFWAAVSRPDDANGFNVSIAQARREVDGLIQELPIVPDPPDLLQRWLELVTLHEVRGRKVYDARLAALMIGAGVSHILTNNAQDFSRFAEVQTIVPGQG